MGKKVIIFRSRKVKASWKLELFKTKAQLKENSLTNRVGDMEKRSRQYLKEAGQEID